MAKNQSFFEEYGGLEVAVVSASPKVRQVFQSFFEEYGGLVRHYEERDIKSLLADIHVNHSLLIADFSGSRKNGQRGKTDLTELVKLSRRKRMLTLGVNMPTSKIDMVSESISMAKKRPTISGINSRKIEALIGRVAPKLYAFFGETCSGKTHTSGYFLSLNQPDSPIASIKTYTTRPLRHWEGKQEYRFLSDAEFDKLEKDANKDLMTYKYADTNIRYGVDLNEIRSTLETGRDAALVGNLRILTELQNTFGDDLVPIKIGVSRNSRDTSRILAGRLHDRFLNNDFGDCEKAKQEYDARISNLAKQIETFERARERFRYEVLTADETGGERNGADLGYLMRKILETERRLHTHPSTAAELHTKYVHSALSAVFGQERPHQGAHIVGLPSEPTEDLPSEKLAVLRAAEVSGIERPKDHKLVVYLKEPERVQDKFVAVPGEAQPIMVLDYINNRLEDLGYAVFKVINGVKKCEIRLTDTASDLTKITEATISYKG